MYSRSRAIVRCASSSYAEPAEIRRNRTCSLSLRFPRPSAMLAGIDIAARVIWLRNSAKPDAREAVTARLTASASACAFCQALSSLKSDMGEACAISACTVAAFPGGRYRFRPDAPRRPTPSDLKPEAYLFPSVASDLRPEAGGLRAAA